MITFAKERHCLRYYDEVIWSYCNEITAWFCNKIVEMPIMSYSCQEPFAAKDYGLCDHYVSQWSNMALYTIHCFLQSGTVQEPGHFEFSPV